MGLRAPHCSNPDRSCLRTVPARLRGSFRLLDAVDREELLPPDTIRIQRVAGQALALVRIAVAHGSVIAGALDLLVTAGSVAVALRPCLLRQPARRGAHFVSIDSGRITGVAHPQMDYTCTPDYSMRMRTGSTLHVSPSYWR